MTLRTPSLLAAAVLASLSMAAQAVTPPASKLTVTETVAQNADSTWHYAFNVTNTDLTGVWFIAFGTGTDVANNPDAAPIATAKLWNGWTDTDTGNIFANGPSYITFTNSTFASTGSKLAVGKTETYSFDLANALSGPVSYVYLTASQVGAFTYTTATDGSITVKDPGTTLSGFAYAAGTVPEPESYGLFMAGLTALGLLARRRRAA